MRPEDWIPVDKDNLPKGRVLVMNTNKGVYMIGSMHKALNTVKCSNGAMSNRHYSIIATHYQLLVPPNK